uniref:Uncharacterized protein n=1 Tax=Anguilla anguilla TaxID=7936 RepID=A0A0E9U910_ANGAN
MSEGLAVLGSRITGEYFTIPSNFCQTWNFRFPRCLASLISKPETSGS